MANLKISELSGYTGSPVGTFIVVNNSSENATYKMERSAFLSPISTFSPVYGLFSQTGDSATVSGTTEQSIVGGGVGSLTIPANGFSVGDTFIARIYGHLANNNNNFNIRIKSDSAILAESGDINYSTSTDELLMELELLFVVKSVGGTGVAEILTKGNLKTIKNSNTSVNGYAFEDHNNTTFDTTSESTLDITFQFDTSASDTYVYSDFMSLTKLY